MKEEKQLKVFAGLIPAIGLVGTLLAVNDLLILAGVVLVIDLALLVWTGVLFRKSKTQDGDS